jgi:hypothetical protein
VGHRRHSPSASCTATIGGPSGLLPSVVPTALGPALPGQNLGSVVWTVEADKSTAIDNYRVKGTITITNPNNIDVDVTIEDELDDGTQIDVDCPSLTVPANGQLVCTYQESLGDSSSATKNIATVTPTTPDIPPSDPAEASFTFHPNVIGDKEVTLADERFSFEKLIDGDKTKTFGESFTCPTDPSLYTSDGYSWTEKNVATLQGPNTDLEAKAKVTLTCVPPEWCSPGYWRQPQHLDSWAATGISPDDLYSDYFGAPPPLTKRGVSEGAPTDPTLLEVLQNPQWYGGDAFNNVGDLLSEAHPDVDFMEGFRVGSCPLN